MKKCEINDLYIGQFYEEEYVVSEEMGKKFADLSGDYNPIHLEEAIAKDTRFGRKIVHGMLASSFFSGIIGNKFPGEGSVYITQEMKFKRPIYYDMPIKVRVEVIDIVLEKRHVYLNTQCIDCDGNLLIDGKAKILFE